MMNKRLKKGIPLLLAVALTVPFLTLPGVKAANAIDTEKKCSVEFNIGDLESELVNSGNPVKVTLYKVASVDASGNYTATEAFTGLDVSFVSGDNKEAAASTWADRAKEAKKILKDSKEEDSKEEITPAYTVTLDGGQGCGTNLDTGLYLVDTKKVTTEHYTYTFTPYLISLPNNNYYSTGNDDWIYDLTTETGNAVGLKPEEHVRYGNLVINKELISHNNTFGDKATFVFDIKIVPLKGEAEDRIESLTFDGAGSDSVTIEKIPAGSTVTVTEAYSGASYKLVSGNDVTATILADEAVSVSFVNENDGRTNGGYGIRNNFALDQHDQYQYTEPASEK